jgi:hypothetical protein
MAVTANRPNAVKASMDYLGFRGFTTALKARSAPFSVSWFFVCGLHMTSLLPATSPDRESKPQRLGATIAVEGVKLSSAIHNRCGQGAKPSAKGPLKLATEITDVAMG